MESYLTEVFRDMLDLYILYIEYEMSKARRWWVRPLNEDRDIHGYYVSCYRRMKAIDPEEFFTETRMTRPVYNLLLNLLADDLPKRSIRPSIEYECRLAITLSFLSQGVSYRFLATSYKMDKSTVREVVLDTCDILWRVLSPIYVTRSTEADYVNIARECEDKWNVPNCCGAIDGNHIEIKAPPKSGSHFFNYKSFCIVLLAVCDANYTFTDICVGAQTCVGKDKQIHSCTEKNVYVLRPRQDIYQQESC